MSHAHRGRAGRTVGPLLPLALFACGGGDAPVQLAYRLDAAPGSAFEAVLEQDISFAMGDHAMDGTRGLRGRYTIRGDRTGTGSELTGTVRIDTLRASLIWGQNETRIDTRHLAGREFPIAVARAGGAPAYDDENVPVVDLGGAGGGPVPASLLIDYGFPTLPVEAVVPGDTWSEARTGRRLEATVWVTADVRTTHRVARTTTIDGTPCLRIESESVGTLSDGFAHGMDIEYTGELHGTAAWCFDTRAGALVQMAGEERTDGTTSLPGGEETTIAQTTRIEIHRVTAGEGEAR